LFLGERQDVIDCLLARGLSAAGEDVNAETACRLLAAHCSSVVQLPPTLPELELEGWDTESYTLAREECEGLVAELQVRAVAAELQQLLASNLYPGQRRGRACRARRSGGAAEPGAAVAACTGCNAVGRERARKQVSAHASERCERGPPRVRDAPSVTQHLQRAASQLASMATEARIVLFPVQDNAVRRQAACRARLRSAAGAHGLTRARGTPRSGAGLRPSAAVVPGQRAQDGCARGRGGRASFRRRPLSPKPAQHGVCCRLSAADAPAAARLPRWVAPAPGRRALGTLAAARSHCAHVHALRLRR
jgi:hypothetical protein